MFVFPSKHPSTAHCILSSVPLSFTEQRMKVEKSEMNREEKQVDGDE